MSERVEAWVCKSCPAHGTKDSNTRAVRHNESSGHHTVVMTDLLRVTDCCGRLLPVSLTLVGDTHIPDLCPACSWLDGRAHDSHVTCDWSKGIDCPDRDWTYPKGGWR